MGLFGDACRATPASTARHEKKRGTKTRDSDLVKENVDHKDTNTGSQ